MNISLKNIKEVEVLDDSIRAEEKKFIKNGSIFILETCLPYIVEQLKTSGILAFRYEEIESLVSVFHKYFSKIEKISYSQTKEFVRKLSPEIEERRNIREIKQAETDENSYIRELVKKVLDDFIAHTLKQVSKIRTDELTPEEIEEIRKSLLNELEKNPELTGKELQESVPESAKAFTEKRLELIARTEGTRIANKARLEMFRQSKIVKYVQFLAVRDDRTTQICMSRHGTVLRLDDPRLPSFTPPLHFHCRSILSPITKYDKEQPTDSQEIDKIIENNPLPDKWNNKKEKVIQHDIGNYNKDLVKDLKMGGRHYLNRMTSANSPDNSVIYNVSKEDIKRDLYEIKSGNAVVNPDNKNIFQVSSGRSYGYHGKTFYPIEGDGIAKLTRTGYGLLHDYIQVFKDEVNENKDDKNKKTLKDVEKTISKYLEYNLITKEELNVIKTIVNIYLETYNK